MKIYTLMENTACHGDFSCEHGLSLYIETMGRHILFDAGQSGAFADNAARVGVDLSHVDAAILSHGHYDHSGGFGRFLECNHTAPIYLTQEALEPHYHDLRYIGVSPDLLRSPRLHFVRENITLFPGITLRRDLTLRRKIDHGGLSVVEKGIKKAEDFRHEQYLLIEEDGRRIVISGCSHRGIENIAVHFRPDILIGGFHFSKLPPEDPRLLSAAETLKAIGCTCYTGHCTGQAQFDVMKQILGDQLHYLRAGSIRDLGHQGSDV